MAVKESADVLAPILDEVARAIARHGIKEGSVWGAKAALRVELEKHVRRTVQAYWTPFEAVIPGRSIGLHLEIAEPTVHWAEAYLTPDHRNWVFIFAERPDGDIQLAHYADYATPQETLQKFFDLSSWYVLEATNTSWADVVFQVSDELTWTEVEQTLAGASQSSAVQESIKKSTIMWLRWRTDREHTMPVWYFNDQKAGKVYVLSGERQQTLPGAETIRDATAILRWKGKNASVAEIPANVRVIKGTDSDWDEIADRVAEKRLNIPGLPEDTAQRWKDECVILELTLRT